MKRNVKFFATTIALGAMCMMAACSGEELDVPIVEETIDGSHWERADINLNVHRVNFDAQAGTTRSVDEGWKDGDRIYLILKDKDGNNVQAYVEYDTVSTSWGQVEYDGYKSYLTCTTPRTVEAYFLDGAKNVTASEITFEATTGVYVCKNGIYTYPSDGDLEVSISLVPLTSRIRFTGNVGTNLTILNGLKTYTKFSRTTGMLTSTLASISTTVDTTGTTPFIYGVFANSEEPSLEVVNNRDRFNTVFEASTNVLQVGHSGYMSIPTEDSHRGWKQVFVKATKISLDRKELVISKGETTILNFSLTPTYPTSGIVWSSSNTSVVTVSNAGVITAVAVGNATITATADDNTSVKDVCTITVVDANGHAYVDLELTSGTLWATMNVGATSPSDYGDYFAWGEVESKANFSWSTYKHCKGSSSTLTKYCHDFDNGTVDGKQELEFLDDAARQNWGGSWRMPSETQVQELINECTWKWTTLDGVIYGYQVISKKDSNISIFLPAAGYYTGTTLYNSGAYGYYWTRENRKSSSSYDYSYYAYFLSFSISSHKTSTNYRYWGIPVRPVLESEP